MPMRMALCGENATVLDSTIMLTGGIREFRQDVTFRAAHLSISRSHLGATKMEDFHIVTEVVLALATSSVANVMLWVSGNASIVESNMTGKYKLELSGSRNHVENSHFSACYGSCVSIRNFSYAAFVGSSMQTAVSVGGKIGAHLEIRDMEIFDVDTPFLQYLGDVDNDEGLRW